MHSNTELDLPQFNILSSETEYKDYKRCFKFCIKDFQQNFIQQNEQVCSDNCMKKYQQASIFLSQIMDNQLNQMVTSDLRLKQAFAQTGPQVDQNQI